MPLIALHEAGYRAGEKVLLSGLNWTLETGEHWLLLGANGAGKSTFLRLIRGEIFPSPGFGRRVYDFGEGPSESPIGVRERIGLVSPDAFERYTAFNINIAARRIVATGLTDSLLVHRALSPEEWAATDAVMTRLGVTPLAETPFMSLSRGQARKILLARALVNSPRVLLLDEFLSHLDAEARQSLTALLAAETARGLTVILTSHRPSEVPDFILRAALLQDGRLAFTGTPAEAARLYRTPTPAPAPAPAPAPVPPPSGDASPILRLSRARVDIEGRTILQPLDWEVLPGEHWAVLGPNGAGKSTLLDLLYGERHPMPGGFIEYFGGLRLAEDGTTSAILRQRMSLVSDRFQANYDADVPVLDVAVSGIFSSIGLWTDPGPADLAAARQALALTGMAHLTGRPFGSLSFGQRRRVMLARALANNPSLLLLDEPCEGLDASSRTTFLHLLDTCAANGQTIIVVAHDPADIPSCVNRTLHLRQGQAAVESRGA